jgi:hypothetical protein
MHFPRLTLLPILMLFFTSCGIGSNETPSNGIPTPTPFQPQNASASDSLYASAAPTPIQFPTTSAASLAPTTIPASPEALSANVVAPTYVPLANLNPLTGLPPSDPSLLERRPMAIKVANYPRYIRPQSGLTLADTVFEYYIEDGLTRFIAVFYGNDSEWVGPVRSGRYFDENIQRMYHAYLVFKFADPRELDYFRSSDFAKFLVVPTNGSCPPFRLMESRNIEVYNNSYFNTLLWEDCVTQDGLDNQRPYIRNGLFSAPAPQSQLLGTQMFAYYSVDSYNYWVYVPESGEYVRYQETADIRDGKTEQFDVLMDAVTATPVHASNVVYLFASHTFANPFDEEDEVYQIDLTGSGEAYVFRDGAGIVARWHRTSRDQPLSFSGPNGAPIYLKPGITFYEVLGERSFVDQDAGEWHFHHDVP